MFLSLVGMGLLLFKWTARFLCFKVLKGSRCFNKLWGLNRMFQCLDGLVRRCSVKA